MANAIAFLDESGDTGRVDLGGSPLFVVALVVFRDRSDAEDCEQRIAAVRQQRQVPAHFEFRFRNNTDAVRRLFLAAVVPARFTYYAAVFRKDARQQEYGGALYLTACATVCALAGAELDRATLVLDEGSQDRFVQRRLAQALRNRVNGAAQRELLAGVKLQDSSRNALVQLADYVAGVVRRDEQETAARGAAEYRRILARHEAMLRRGRA